MNLKKLNEAHCKNENVKNAFLFSCYTGLRKGDVKKLRKKNLMNDNCIKTEMEKTGNYTAIPYDYKAIKYIPNFENRKDEDLLFNLPAWSTVSSILKELGSSR